MWHSDAIHYDYDTSIPYYDAIHYDYDTSDSQYEARMNEYDASVNNGEAISLFCGRWKDQKGQAEDDNSASLYSNGPLLMRGLIRIIKPLLLLLSIF